MEESGRSAHASVGAELEELQRVLANRWCSAHWRAQQLTEIAYRRLYGIAASLLGFSSGTPTLGPTALVSEGYAKMFCAGQFKEIRDPGHFYARFTLSMKHIIIDYFRSKQTEKQGRNWRRQDWIEHLEASVDPMFAELDLLDALAMLAERHPNCAVAFELQFFGRLTVTEIMHSTGHNRSQVEADLRFAKAFLRVQFAAQSS